MFSPFHIRTSPSTTTNTDAQSEKPHTQPRAPPFRDEESQDPADHEDADLSPGLLTGETYPEGGAQAWLVVLGAWFALVSALGLINILSAFQAYVSEHQLKEYSEGTLGWAFSTYTFLAYACGVYAGPVFDKYGPRWLTMSGVLCVVTGLLLMSFSTELWQFVLSFGVLCGTGFALIFTPCLAAIGHWFMARRGFATGIASTAGGFGGIAFPIMLDRLYDQVGFAWAIRALALICLCCGAVGAMLVRSRLPAAKNASVHPDFLIFRQVPFLLTTAGIFLLELGLFIPLAYTTTYALANGFSQTFAYELLAILNAASVVGRVLPGYCADKLGSFNTCIASALLTAVACLCVWLPFGQTTAGITLFAILFGFGSGTGITVTPVCVGRLCKTQQYGRYYASCYTVVSIACLTGIPIAGSLVQAAGGHYDGLIIFTGSVYLGSVVMLLWAKAAKLGWKNLTALW